MTGKTKPEGTESNNTKTPSSHKKTTELEEGPLTTFEEAKAYAAQKGVKMASLQDIINEDSVAKERRVQKEGKKYVELAVECINTLMGDRLRLSEGPGIRFVANCRELDMGGCYRNGDKDIEVDKAYSIATIVPHEVFHFWQGKIGFLAKCTSVPFRLDDKGDLVYMPSELIKSQLPEPGAYFFEAVFSHVWSMNEERSGTTQKKIHRIVEALRNEHPTLSVNIVSDIQLNIEKGDLGEVASIAIGSRLGRAVALLVFAASNYDMKKTLDVLSSSPEEILDTVKHMSAKETEMLFDRLKEP